MIRETALTGRLVSRKLASGKKRKSQEERDRKSAPLAADPHREIGIAYDECAAGRTLYAYVGNDPVNATDPDGRFGLQIAGGIAGAIIGGGASILKGNDFRTVLKDAAIGGAVGVLSTIPGGGAVAVGLRAGLASGAGDAVSQALDKGIDNVDLTQSGKEAVIGGLTGGLVKGGVDKLIPNRAIPGMSSTHPLVREGRAIAQEGSEAAAAPIRNASEVAGAAVIGGSVAGARALTSEPGTPSPPPKPEPKKRL